MEPPVDTNASSVSLDSAPVSSAPRELYRIRPQVWVGDMLLDWAVIIGVFVFMAYFWSWWLVPLASLIIGARIHALGLLAHDATHRLAFKSRRLNELFGEVIVAWPLLIVIDEGYRPWHFDHHRHLGSHNDPELGSYRAASPYDKPVTWKMVCLYFIHDMLGLGLPGLLKFSAAIYPNKQPWRIGGPVALWLAFFLITFFYHSTWIFWLYSWSLISGFWAVFRVRTWTEHVGIEHRGKETSHRFITGPIGRFLFFPHNTFCHYEHHKWPQIPYYNLPKLRAMDASRPVQPLGDLFPMLHGDRV
ncbi:MAG: hypothetical protein JWO89_2771 [Verrucomicrobiaceae bacterium]|nr:hypothetical protein [Verrucomicrobiaceae bacterium]MDB6120549.1 hypothetical protein [Verrucomicrobiaceae bacterium]